MPTAEQISAAVAADGILDGFTLAVRISSRRRTLGVTVEPGGTTLTIAVPAALDTQHVIAGLHRIRPRIAGHVVKARENAPDFHVPALTDGAGFTWLGRSLRLRTLDGRAPAARDGERLTIGRDLLARDGAKPIIRWYCEQGTAWLEQEAPALWSRLMPPGTPPPELRVADIGRKRWGKYEPARHRVTLAWQTMQLRPSLARYVLGHELAHATRPAGAAHGPEFWRVTERVIPLAREEQRRLAREGRTVWMGDTRP
ncbi:M48 family metallopeptidase [Streptomyces glaucus]|uniref:M48 family metallopeptidase n=1 Tax=Streptomyces glaucus TaxID=284029 RepID=A0ABN3JTY2_9ACTN